METLNLDSLYSAFNELKIEEQLTDNNNHNGCMRCGCTDIRNTSDGDNVCQECGNVSQSNTINEYAEWNNFNLESGERCEYNNNELLHGDNMCTQVSFKRCMKQSDWALMKWQRTMQLSSKNRSLIKVYTRIENQCLNHDINQTIINTTKTLYKFVSALKLSRGAVREAMLASCLYYAFIHHYNPRNIEEVSLVFEANTKKVNKTNKILSQYLWHSEHKNLILNEVNTEQIIHRYCNKIDINTIHTARIVNLANIYERHDNMIGKDCSYIAALAIYNFSKENNLHISKDDICDACFLSTVTLNKLLKNNISMK